MDHHCQHPDRSADLSTCHLHSLEGNISDCTAFSNVQILLEYLYHIVPAEHYTEYKHNCTVRRWLVYFSLA